MISKIISVYGNGRYGDLEFRKGLKGGILQTTSQQLAQFLTIEILLLVGHHTDSKWILFTSHYYLIGIMEPDDYYGIVSECQSLAAIHMPELFRAK